MNDFSDWQKASCANCVNTKCPPGYHRPRGEDWDPHPWNFCCYGWKGALENNVKSCFSCTHDEDCKVYPCHADSDLCQAWKLKQSLINNATFKYLGTCSNFRSNEKTGYMWQEMMKTREEITESMFLQKCCASDVLSVGETWNQYKNVAGIEGSPIKFYKSSNGLYFFKRAGFEFIWG